MTVPGALLYSPPPRFALAGFGSLPIYRGDLYPEDLRVPFMASMGLGSALTDVNAAGAFITGIAPATGPAAPYVAAVGQLVQLGAKIASLFQGCGASCIQSTEFANQFEDALNQLKAAYDSQPIHYKSLQTQTLGYMQSAADQLRKACSDPALGAAGQRCISERLVRGGTAPWCPTPSHTGCDFWSTYYDPIANDPTVVPDPPAVSSAAASLGLTTSTGTMNWGMLALLGVGLVVLFTFL